MGVREISENCFKPQNFLIKHPDFDVEEDKSMTTFVQFRGDVKAKDANPTVQWLRADKKVVFADWGACHFTVRTHEVQPVVLPNDDIAASNKDAVGVSNNTAISRFFSERISKKYDLMMAQKSYVHWYLAE